jgi:hypothetical protein
MVASEAQKRAIAKWTAKPESKIKLYNNVVRNRQLHPYKYLESQRKATRKYHAKKLGITLEEYESETTLKCIRYLYC